VSGWHRDNPELVGTDADPWMRHESYRRYVPMPESERERLRDEREEFERERDREAADAQKRGDFTSS
jgi:hypothetical protein